MTQTAKVLVQAAIVLALVLWGAALVSTLAGNLNERSIPFGFGFLGERAGFPISQTLIAYTEDASYARVFLVGLLNTLLVSALGIVFASILGLSLGLARLSPNWLMRKLSGSVVETTRNLPLLLHLFFWYFVVLRALPAPRASFELGLGAVINNRGAYLPGLTVEQGTAWLLLAGIAGLGVAAAGYLKGAWRTPGAIISGVAAAVVCAGIFWLFGVVAVSWEVPAFQGFNYRGGVRLIPEFIALVAALSLYSASYIAEITRAGVLAVPRGQIEAGRALGLAPRAITRRVLLPQALRLMIPPLASQYLNLTKNSSLAVAIAYPDLVSVFAGTALNQSGAQVLEILAMTMAVYLTLSLLTAGIMNGVNARIRARGSVAHG